MVTPITISQSPRCLVLSECNGYLNDDSVIMEFIASFILMSVSLQLTAEKKVDRRLLPPKKILGKNSKSLVERRQKELELYLQTLLQQFPHATPTPLACFLHFHLYVSTPEALITYNLGTCNANCFGTSSF